MNAMNAYIIKKASNKHPDVYSTSSNYHHFVELNHQKSRKKYGFTQPI